MITASQMTTFSGHHDQQFDPLGSVPDTSGDSLSKGDRVIVCGQLRARGWETPEGERRSVVEVQAEEAGPSLKWATATPQRTSKANSSTKGQFSDDPPL